MLLNDRRGAICDEKLNVSELLKPDHFLGQLIHRFQIKRYSGGVIWYGDESQAQKPRRVIVVQSRQEETAKVVTNAVEGINPFVVEYLYDISNHDSASVFQRRFGFGRTAISEGIGCYDAVALVHEEPDLMPPPRGNGGEAMEKGNGTFCWSSRLDADVVVRVARRRYSVCLCGKFRHILSKDSYEYGRGRVNNAHQSARWDRSNL